MDLSVVGTMGRKCVMPQLVSTMMIASGQYADPPSNWQLPGPRATDFQILAVITGGYVTFTGIGYDGEMFYRFNCLVKELI
jgi:hypothetical protein